MKKKMIIVGMALLSTQNFAVDVKITEGIESIIAKHKGNNILIQRIQDPENRLDNIFSKTSRMCPPYCIQPMYIENIKTVGEIEVLEYIKKMNKEDGYMLIDSRTRKWYNQGTIPSAINLPFTILEKNGYYVRQILKLLGVKKVDEGWDFSNVQTLLIFSNGAWDEQATKAIRSLIDKGYPQDKILYYRGGMQMWNSVGLTVK